MKLLKVPYTKQIDESACGAACLEMVYKYYGINNISQEDLMNLYKELEPHGSGYYRMTTDTLILDARKKGLKAVWLRANYTNKFDCLELLKILIDKEVPIIVCQQASQENALLGHFRIVIGFDDQFVYLHDPNFQIAGNELRWSIEDFVSLWQPTGANVTGGILCVITK